MSIAFIAPLVRAWERAERMLFRPFQIGVWLVVGFAAFLSEFLSGSTGLSFKNRTHWGPGVPESPREAVRQVIEFFQHPGMLALAVAVLFCVLLLALLVLWIGSRGRFVFLDDIVRGRAAIVEPWHRCAALGDSLFGWMIVFILVCIGASVLIALPFIATIQSLWSEGTFQWSALASLAGLLFMLVPVGLAVAGTMLFLYHFVIPIMYRHGLPVTVAWGRFLGLFRAHPFAFIGFALMSIVIHAVFITLVIMVGLGTCCVGFILFGTPYVCQVVLLPYHATMRAWGPEFMAQFGPEYDAFAGVPASPAPPAPPASAPPASPASAPPVPPAQGVAS